MPLILYLKQISECTKASTEHQGGQTALQESCEFHYILGGIHVIEPAEDVGRNDTGFFQCCVSGLERFLKICQSGMGLQPHPLKEHQFFFLLGLDISHITMCRMAQSFHISDQELIPRMLKWPSINSQKILEREGQKKDQDRRFRRTWPAFMPKLTH